MSDGTSSHPDQPDQPEQPRDPKRYGDSTDAYRQAPPPQGEPYGGYQSMPDMSAGPSEPAPRASAPSSITNAVKLMYVGAGISLIGIIVSLLSTGDMRASVRDALRQQGKSLDPDIVDQTVTVGIILGVVFGLVGVGLWLWMARMNGNGRSWARIVATVLGGINILFTVVSLGRSTATGVSSVLGIISAILAVVILVLLWRKESSEYYAARSAPR